MNLYEINHEIMSCWDETTGEILDTQKFDALQLAMEEKLEGIGCYIKNLKAEAEALKAEEKAFAERRKRAENKAASLENYLANFLQGCPFETLRVKISFRKSEYLDIKEDAVIPAEYLKQQDPTIDKAGLKAAIKEGKIDGLKGVQLLERQNLQVK